MNQKDLLEDSESCWVYRPTSVNSERSGKPTKQRNILVIEDDNADFKFIERSLTEAVGVSFKVERAVRLAEGLKRLAEGGIHLVLLDLGLPDSQRLDTFRTFQAHAPDVPVIVLSGVDDQSIAIWAVKGGAQDYLVKGNLDPELLLRSIHYARGRHRAKHKLSRALRSAEVAESNLHNVISGNVDGMIVVDQQGMVQFSNDAAHKLLGCSAEELRNAAFGFPAVIDKTTELELRRPGGEQRPVEMRVVTVEWEDQPCCLAVLRDLTDRKLAEQDHIKRLEAEREIRIARQVQQSLFPDGAPSLAGFDIAGAVYPAEQASGDYYDFIPMADGSLGVVVGDVSGHGLGPALLMAQTQAHLRALAETQNDLGEIVTRANRLMRTRGNGRFVTLFLACIAPQARSINYACAGHRGYLLSAAGDTKMLEGTAPPLGVLEDMVVASSPVTGLTAGDILVATTDGVEESMSFDKKLFGKRRLIDVVRANRDRSSQEIVQALYEAARKFAEGGRQADDIAAIVVKVLNDG